MRLFELIVRHPLQALLFTYTFVAQSVLVVVKRVLLPHIPFYQSLRIQLHRAYLSSCSATFPDLAWRLPVGPVSQSKAQLIQEAEFTGYLIPGTRCIQDIVEIDTKTPKCVVLYAHGGGYARGEAKMYMSYMERWVSVAKESGLDLVFLSVEYRELSITCMSTAKDFSALSSKTPHPAQRNAFLGAYTYLLHQGLEPENIVFMGDSAGGKLSPLSITTRR